MIKKKSDLHAKGRQLWLFKICKISISFLALNADFISKQCDFHDGGILKMMFCTLIVTIVTRILIIKQHFGFGTHGFLP